MSDSLWPMDCSLPGSSVHGILQARTLEWVAIAFSVGSPPPRDRTWVSCMAGRFFTIWDTREDPKMDPEWQNQGTRYLEGRWQVKMLDRNAPLPTERVCLGIPCRLWTGTRAWGCKVWMAIPRAQHRGRSWRICSVSRGLSLRLPAGLLLV